MARKGDSSFDFRQADSAAKTFNTLYYTAALHTGVLVTPPFVQAALKG
jgi:spermidine synthase